MADIPPISAHLKVCPYYETSVHSKPVALPSVRDQQEAGKDRLSLVRQFTGQRWQQ